MQKGWFISGALSLCAAVPGAAHDNYSWNDHWYLLGEFVYMRRADLANKSLVTQKSCSTCSTNTAIDTKDLINDFEFEPGFRVGLTYAESVKNNFEINYLWVDEWNANIDKYSPGTLSFPFSKSYYASDFTFADEAEVGYKSHFWDVEANYWRNFTPRRVDYFSLSGIAGLRYFNIRESFSLTMASPSEIGQYNIKSANDVFGVQVGFDFCWNPTRYLTWEFLAKVGGMANHSKQKTYLNNDGDILRDWRVLKWQIGVFADVAAQIAFQFKDHLNLHVGYEMIYLSGLALAPEQVSKRTTPSAGKDDYTHGNAIIHGVFAGMVISF